MVNRTAYRPFGGITYEQTWSPVHVPDDKGYIGERLDRAAGLQYLNARYYDPELALFTSPDWFEVTQPGVGTNRYSYSFNDPINLADPGGNIVHGPGQLFGEGGFFDNLFGGDNRRRDSNGDGRSDWAEYQLAAYRNGGTLGFDEFRQSSEIYESFGNPFDGGGGSVVFSTRNPMQYLDKVAVLCSRAKACSNTLIKPVDRFFSNLRKLFSASPRLSNKAQHIFGPRSLQRHKLQDVLRYYNGNATAATRALERAFERAARNNQLSSFGNPVNNVYQGTVRVAGRNVVVRGQITSGGRANIGTAYIP